MKKLLFFSIACIICLQNYAQMKPESTEVYYPKPTKVIAAKAFGQAPSDAIVLFDGRDLSKWNTEGGGDAKWNIDDGILTVTKNGGNIFTKDYFGDCQLHLEFKSPTPDKTKKGQGSGNSGVFLQCQYEVQILDGEDNPTYVNGMVGSIYKQFAPQFDAYTQNGDWQVYDIFWKAPVFGTDGKLESPAIITVLLNGVLIQNNVVLKGTTEYIGFPKYNAHGRLPLMIQNHNDPVSFRNIWIRNL